MNDLIPSIAALALSVSLFVETSSWWIKVGATKDNFGHYISRSNIYLYGGRFFSLIFGVFLAFQIERGVPPAYISLTLSSSFALAFCLQLLLLNGLTRRYIIYLLSLLLGLTPAKSADSHGPGLSRLDRPLFFGTLIASLSFSMGLAVPPLLAAIYIPNRLVISNIGQLINAFGMIIILFFVDQKLYRAFDSGNLYTHLVSYSKARSLAFLLMFAIFFIIFAIMINA